MTNYRADKWDSTVRSAEAAARRRGTAFAASMTPESAAAWYECDECPSPLSGEWAGDYSMVDLERDFADDVYDPADGDDADVCAADAMEALADIYEAEFARAIDDELDRRGLGSKVTEARQ